MEVADGVERGEAGADGLSASGKAGHEMGFNQTGHDTEPCVAVGAVQGDGIPGAGEFSCFAKGGVILGAVIFDSERAGEVCTEHGDVFVRPAGSVHAGGDEEKDFVARDAGCGEGIDQAGQEAVVGNGPCDVGDDDDDVAWFAMPNAFI